MTNLISKTDRVEDTISSCESRVNKLYSKTSDNKQSLPSPKLEHTDTHFSKKVVSYDLTVLNGDLA